MSRQILAIDIRNEAIAAVLITKGLKSNTVMGSAHLPIRAQSEDGDALSQSLALLLEQLNPTAPNIVVSLPADHALFRFIKVPFKEDNKIRQILPFELEPTLPISTDNLKIDFQKSVSGDQTHVLAVAIDQSVFQNYMSKLTAANIRPQLVVPAGFPLVAQIMAIEDQSEAKILFLDVGAEKTTLFALRSGRIEMVRNLPSAVGDETDMEALALRVRQTIAAWSDISHDDTAAEMIYVSGPGFQDPGQVERLSQAIEIAVQSIDLRQWLPRVEIPDTVQWHPNLMNEALALAILEAEDKPCPNFHRISSPLRNYWSAYRPYIMVPAILLAMVLIIASGGVLLDNYYLKKRVDELDMKLAQVFKSTFPDTRLTAPPLDQMKSRLKEIKKGGSGSEQNAVQTRSIDVLLQISQSIPENVDVVLSRMTISADEVTVSGETTDFNTVDDIKSRLEKSETFKQITIASANMDKSGKKVLFKLKIDL
jgi:general secretion pathway protein L